jgi:putative membrane protein
MIFISIVLGILFGIITGLIPGVHINLIATFILAILPTITKFITTKEAAVFIISMSTVHTFLDAIPSIFLGAPDEAHALSALPGHKLLLERKGKQAVMLTVVGSYLSLLLSILLVPLIIIAINFLYPLIKNHIGILLIIIVSIIIILSKKILRSSFIFLLSGILGIIILDNPSIQNPLFPLLSGLFGISILLTSLNNKNTIPKQDTKIKLNMRQSIYPTILATIFGFIASFMPGMGSSQSAILATRFMKSNTEKFMILIGGINTVNMTLSLITLFVLNKARNGAILAVKEILNKITITELVLFLSVALIAGSFAVILSSILSTGFSKIIPKINYKISCSNNHLVYFYYDTISFKLDWINYFDNCNCFRNNN